MEIQISFYYIFKFLSLHLTIHDRLQTCLNVNIYTQLVTARLSGYCYVHAEL